MHASDEASVDELRRQSEQTRAALSNTVTELRDKVSDTAAELKMRASPDYIKQELRQYVSEKKQGFVDSIQERVRENPLQAVAVGAAIAYPLLGILRAIPGPMMLIGAGLWLTSKRGQQTTRQMSQRASEAMNEAGSQLSGMVGSAQHAAAQQAERFGDAVGGMTSRASSRMTGMSDEVRSGASAYADQARRGVQGARDSVGEAGRSAYSSVAGAAESVSDAANSTYSAVSDATGRAAESVAHTASQARDAVYSAGTQSRDFLLETIDRNPLLVAGVGLLAGAAIASLLPASRVENQVFGGTSDALKQKAQEFASDAAQQGVEQAKGMAAGVVTDLAAAAAREGLNSEGLKKAVDSVTQTVKSVAERGMQSAMGGERPLSTDAERGGEGSSQSGMGSERTSSSQSGLGSERPASSQSTSSYKS